MMSFDPADQIFVIWFYRSRCRRELGVSWCHWMTIKRSFYFHIRACGHINNVDHLSYFHYLTALLNEAFPITQEV